jgi:hypothetical protein
VKEIQSNVLYHLKPNRPVIDAVAYVNQTLLLIQVSLSEYERHKSKAGDLRMLYKDVKVMLSQKLLIGWSIIIIAYQQM